MIADSWRLKLCSEDSLADLAGQINRTVRGWINFYGRFYRSKLMSLLENINEVTGPRLSVHHD